MSHVLECSSCAEELRLTSGCNAQQDLFFFSDLAHSPSSERSLQDGGRLLPCAVCRSVCVL